MVRAGTLEDPSPKVKSCPLWIAKKGEGARRASLSLSPRYYLSWLKTKERRNLVLSFTMKTVLVVNNILLVWTRAGS